MSYFRNVQNDGVWEPGGTYTFEVFLQNDIGSSGLEYPCDWRTDYSVLASGNYAFNSVPCGGNFPNSGSANNNCLFTDQEETTDDYVENSEHNAIGLWEDMGDGWWKVTVTVPESIENGTYYLKQVKDYYNYTIG